MENTKSKLQKWQEDNILARVSISTDRLFLVKDTDDSHGYDIVLDGNDDDTYIMEGPIDAIFELIQLCCDARDNKKEAYLEFKDLILIFN